MEAQRSTAQSKIVSAGGGCLDLVPWLHIVFKCQDILVESLRVIAAWYLALTRWKFTNVPAAQREGARFYCTSLMRTYPSFWLTLRTGSFTWDFYMKMNSNCQKWKSSNCWSDWFPDPNQTVVLNDFTPISCLFFLLSNFSFKLSWRQLGNDSEAHL